MGKTLSGLAVPRLALRRIGSRTCSTSICTSLHEVTGPMTFDGLVRPRRVRQRTSPLLLKVYYRTLNIGRPIMIPVSHTQVETLRPQHRNSAFGSASLEGS